MSFIVYLVFTAVVLAAVHASTYTKGKGLFLFKL